MPVEFTQEQKQAIQTRGRDMLVSAAAGSGKTAVLTERIIRLITEGPNGPINLDELLVVTFTEAAAAEMRERIGQKIDERLQQEPGNTHLQRQAALLPAAQVSTIHAFCRRLVKEYFARVDLDPSFKVGDETELSLLRSQVMDDLFEDEYAKNGNDDFLDLVEAFGGRTRDDRLDTLIRDVHEFIESSPYPDDTACSYAALFAQGADNPDDTPWADIIHDELVMGLTGAREAAKAARLLCLAPDGPERYLPALDSDLRILDTLIAALDGTYNEWHEAFNSFTWERIYTYRAKDEVSPSLKNRVKTLRDRDIKERVKNLKQSCFFAPPEKIRDDIRALRDRVGSLVALVLDYRQRYAAEKRARGILDFADLEHYAVQILHEEDNGEPAPVFAFREVLIDEYQDSNAVQEMILSAVAGGAPRFMVGDVKQSIYRFRRANPKLFIDKYLRYQRLDACVLPPENAPARVDLSRNFRSRREVIDTVNFFFSQLMSAEVGEVDYDDKAALYPGADYPDPLDPCDTLIEIVDRGTCSETTAEAESTPETETAPEETAEAELSALELEAEAIARRIRALTGSRPVWDRDLQAYRPCRNGDIVILARSVSSSAGVLTEILKQNGVDAVADISTGFFETLEVGTALSFLRVVDNPRQDIDLITVLHSPVYAFNPDELLTLREACPGEDFYACLTAYAGTEAPSETRQKARQFLNDLSKWRGQAVYLPVSRLIGIIYDDTRYPTYAGALPGGRIRQANLRLLLEHAIQYEETSYKGLFHFVRYIERLKASGGAGSVNAAQLAETDNRVRIMTIHKAKGLEFPIVFVSLLGRVMNREDERRDIVLHPEYGLGPVYVDLAARTKANTLARLGLAKLIRRENLSEELRVIYVALTRAKEMLILTGCVADWERARAKWAEGAGFYETMLPVYFRRECGSYLDWLMPCLARHRDGASLRESGHDGEVACVNPTVYEHPARFTLHIHAADSLRTQETAASEPSHSVLPQENAVMLKPAVYPHEAVRDLPSKVSISELKRQYALETTPDSAPLLSEAAPVYEQPVFLRDTQGINALRIGTALHTVMEHLEIHTHRTRADIDGLINGLAARNLLSPEEAQAIDRGLIERFIRSPLAERMRAAEKVYREIPFVMALEPHEVYPAMTHAGKGEKILVHGIIDCYFEENGRYVLVDYKSDAVVNDPVRWAERHRVQMSIYQKAVARATGEEVSEALLYSFALGDTVRVDMP